ncbi:MAG: glycosyltransferase family 2 protein [Candidatus Micrarchaeia archaeon]
MATLPNLFVYIPTYNVSRQISSLITDLESTLSSLRRSGHIRGYKIICVNDGSTDDTSKILASLKRKVRSLEVISFRKNKGVVDATLAGMSRVAKLSKPDDIAIRMDSDYEHNPDDIPRLISAIKDTSVQMCFAYTPLEMKLGYRFFMLNFLIGGYENKKLFGVWVPQFCPGFFAARASLLKSVLTEVKAAVKEYAQRYSSQMIHLDLYIAYLASRNGKVRFIKASPIKPEWIIRKPLTKVYRYLEAHNNFMEFIAGRKPR